MSDKNGKLYKGLHAISRCDPADLLSSDLLMQRIPDMSQITASPAINPDDPATVASLDGFIERLLLSAEAYGLRAWGVHTWDLLEELIEHHRRQFWQERTLAQYGGPADRARERRANRKKNHHVSTELRHAIFERDGWKCLVCDKATDLTIDHIKPIKEGGNEDLENLRTLCRSCNSHYGGHLGVEGMERYWQKWYGQRDPLSAHDAPPGDGDPAAGDALRDKLG